MTIIDLENLYNDYLNWLKSNTLLQTDNDTGWGIIDTPFLDASNDHIQIFIKENRNGTFTISDDGATERGFLSEGKEIFKGGNRDKARHILLNYGIQYPSDGEIVIECEKKDAAKYKHALLSAVIQLNDTFYSPNQRPQNIFADDVLRFLKANKILYSQPYHMTGISGLISVYDFFLPGYDKEIALKLINRFDRQNVIQFLFSFDDILQIRKEQETEKEFKAVAVINDVNQGESVVEPKEELIAAIASKKADSLLWSHRTEELEKLKVS